jgi:thiamine-phosphate pyrophosphorylase
MPQKHKIYALFDFALNKVKGYDLDRFLNLPKVQEAEILQYRDKVNDSAVKRENILYLKKHFNGSLIANDDVELALLVDGLHVGQEDLLRYETDPLKAAAKLRDLLEDRMLGLSTHNEQEISLANKMPLDYIGLGAYRNTSTKTVSNILGERLSLLAASSRHPVAAIGGVKKCDNIAHVSYLVLGSDLYED